ncbi:integration host factor, actinobacterial type [Kocuria sp.]|uniref:integration host factor, actinobacterial type n=1 Tax=Kocuria sp. TaxID=1871328 RepID=UPI0026E1030C|nr:integration host factor, actinobacterial type [Kocuria sp.]MDO5617669.1 integration host factor, actinobacterial type [Kocuria sp.]
MALRMLTDDERAAARKKATEARAVRAEAKAALKDRKITVAKILERAQEEEALSRLKVSDLLESAPGIGKVRSAAIMEEIGIAKTRRVRGLGVHQRKALIEYLDN